MLDTNKFNFGMGRKLPLMLQTEATECGLACIGMIAAYYDHRSDIVELRRRFSISLKGATLGNLSQIAHQLGLAARPVKLEMGGLSRLRLPCVLHWNFSHFVVLSHVGARYVTIHDPALGIRKVALSEVSAMFTGIALEMWPGSTFVQKAAAPTLPLRHLMGAVSGWKGALARILLLAFALEVFALITPFFMQWIVDNVIVTADRDLLTTLVLGFIMLLLAQQTVVGIRAWGIMFLNTSMNVQWRNNVLTHMLGLPVQYFEKRHLGDVISRFGAIDQIQRTLTTSFLEAMLDGLMTIATLSLMFIYSPPLAWIAVVAMAVYGCTRWIWYQPQRNASEEQIAQAAKQQSHLLETFRGIKTIKLFQRQHERRSTWLTLFVDTLNSELRIQKLDLLFKLLNGVTFGLENIFVVALGASYVLNGTFTVGLLMAFIAYKGQFDTRVSSFIDKLFELRMLRLQADRVADIVLSEPEASSGIDLDGRADDLVPNIELCDLHYRYADHEQMVLNGVNLRIEAGESVAITGPSGCGKSTLLNVLLGVLPATSGEVRIGGVPLSKIGTDTARSIIGTVLQDDVLFAGSIAANISFFDPQVDMAWVRQCAQYAAIHDEIAGMPMGYNSLVGDMGTILSGGQKQRVLLARALYKRPRILVLDEATSHLDSLREHQVNEAIRGLNITRVIVAHRAETIASASRLIVLGQGKVLEDRPTESSTNTFTSADERHLAKVVG